MQREDNSYNSNRIFFVVVIGIIIFGFAGYWFGSRNPGGFTVGPGPVNNVLNIDQEPARTHPGNVSMNINSGLQEYKNDFIGLVFQFPQGWVVQDGWRGDASDLTISGNSLQRQADLVAGKFKAEDQVIFPQFDITFIARLEQLDTNSMGVKNLDEFVSTYSQESNQISGQATPLFTKPEKILVDSLEAYRAENSTSGGGGKIYYVKGIKGYYQITLRSDAELTEEIQNILISNLEFN